jgi:hypothetical protein
VSIIEPHTDSSLAVGLAVLRPVTRAFGCMDFLQAASTPVDYLLEDDQNRESSLYPGLDKYAPGGVGEQTEGENVSAFRL